MKRFLILSLLCLPLIVLPAGCATFSAVTSPTATTPAQQIDAMQRDLDTAKAGANLAHELGKWSKPAEWQALQGEFAIAQKILSDGRKTLDGNPLMTQQDVTDLINSIAQSVHDAKEAAK